MLKKIKNLFLKHPSEIGESYFEHLIAASWIGIRFGIACPMQIIHAIFPFINPPFDSDVTSMENFLKKQSPDSRKNRN